MGLFGSSKKEKLRKKYRKLLEEARDLQRGGDIKGFAVKSDEAEQLLKEIEAMPEK